MASFSNDLFNFDLQVRASTLALCALAILIVAMLSSAPVCAACAPPQRRRARTRALAVTLNLILTSHTATTNTGHGEISSILWAMLPRSAARIAPRLRVPTTSRSARSSASTRISTSTGGPNSNRRETSPPYTSARPPRVAVAPPRSLQLTRLGIDTDPVHHAPRGRSAMDPAQVGRRDPGRDHLRPARPPARGQSRRSRKRCKPSSAGVNQSTHGAIFAARPADGRRAIAGSTPPCPTAVVSARRPAALVRLCELGTHHHSRIRHDLTRSHVPGASPG